MDKNISHHKKVLLHFKDVWKTYLMGEQPLHVLKNINVEIYQGDFTAILGPSGSGKSTLMNLVGILDVPSKGSIYLDGHDISKLSETELAKIRGKKLGFIFQQFNLIPTLTALENVILPTIFQNMSEPSRLEKSQKMLAKVGLADRMHHKPTELSGGQQQRVAIARALMNNPEIILADEPTGNLDSHSGRQIMEMLLNLHSQEHKTIILVTHDTHLVQHVERTISLKDGEIVDIKTKQITHK
ncbi:ABC transporter ATP-binding protein [Candidatus Woesearchaeota archaeon]|nr:ABC transporter ATP-binding protein [Candidatus Woesearchaeota archaeon]